MIVVIISTSIGFLILPVIFMDDNLIDIMELVMHADDLSNEWDVVWEEEIGDLQAAR